MAKGVTSNLLVLATGLLWIWTAGVQLAEAADPGEAAKLLKEAGFPDLLSNKEQGFVLAGQLVAITEGLNETRKGDVLSTIVASKFAADVDFSFEKNFTYWDLVYGLNLAGFGWGPLSHKYDQQFTPTSDKVTINETLEDLLGGILTDKTQNLLTVLTKILDALKKLPDGDPGLTLFENTAGSGTMIVHLISKSPLSLYSDEIWMTTGSFTFHTPSKVSHFLSHKWDKDQVLVVADLKTSHFYDNMFAHRRVKVAQKLKDKGEMNQVIRDINI